MKQDKTIKFGVVGCGLMGREFASAAARWCHLLCDLPRPEIIAVCDLNEQARKWFCDNVPSVRLATSDIREILADPEVEAVYCAVPHNLHQKFYVDIINSGKHLMGEKPFGIDLAANRAILAAAAAHPESVIRCSSEFPYYPAAQELVRDLRSGRFGKVIEVRSSFCHSSDMDINKPINWKRRVETNGEYGCMGDLGLHTEHLPFRMGWIPERVYASLSNIVTKRPDGSGGYADCLTWDNAHLICDIHDGSGGYFPMHLETKRLCPGATNRWSIEVDGLDYSAKFSTDDPGAYWYTQSVGREQAWCRLNIGYKPMIPTVTGGIFEFGFTDAILQMWAAFIAEVAGRKDEITFGCLRPEETELSHRLQTAALLSHRERRSVSLAEI